MTIKGVIRTGLIQLRVLDMEKSIRHYVDIIGLEYVGKAEDGRVFLKGYDEFDHHCVALRETDTAGMDFIAMKVESDEYLKEITEKTIAFGLTVEHIEANSDQPGFGRRVAVTLPMGHRLDLYAEVEMAEDTPMTMNPDIWKQAPRGMAALGIDHALLFGPNVDLTTKYFTEVLELSITEVLKNPENTGNMTVWLTANNKGHDLAILEYPEPGKLHHIGFKLEDWHAIGHAADLISVNDVALDAGPMRHGITRGQTIYFFDPSGNRNETFAGGYAHYPDHPVREWDFAHVGKGIFYYTRELNERFINVVS
ncbi:MAG: catechol 2,3-dioxygenase [Tissierellia bacterium]|nr:catechol 2,3-dioxygenase [Tissierellia bacterium]